jgi:putative sigma-54 modulation protein
MEVTPAIRQYAEDKAGKLPRYFDRINSLEIVLDLVAGMPLVEVVATVPHHQTFVGTHRGEDLYGCIDNALHKVEQQIRRHKEKLREHKGPSHQQQQDIAAQAVDTENNADDSQ